MEHRPTKDQGGKDQWITFQSLSSGIGLGALKAPTDGNTQSRNAPKRSQGLGPESTSALKSGSGASQPRPVVGTAPAFPSPPSTVISSVTALPTLFESRAPGGLVDKRAAHIGRPILRLVIERWLLTFGIDLLFVAITVFVVIVGSTLVNYFRVGKGVPLTDLSPLVWLVGQPWTRLVAGFFAVYLVYVVAFLVCTGCTLGAMSARMPVKTQK